MAVLCEKIAASLGMAEDERDLAWFTGLLHDVGRFEQLRNYGTFIDAESIDHAVYGAQIRKEHILALFTGRNESEVVVDPRHLEQIMESPEPGFDMQMT